MRRESDSNGGQTLRPAKVFQAVGVFGVALLLAFLAVHVARPEGGKRGEDVRSSGEAPPSAPRSVGVRDDVQTRASAKREGVLMADLIIDHDALAGGLPDYDENGNVVSWMDNPGFLLVEISEPKKGAAFEALKATANRWMLVDDRGHEFRDWDEYEAFDGDPASPGWISEPTPEHGGLGLFTDTDGTRTRVMTEKMLAILVEELTARGVGGRITQQRPPPEKG